ncbi:MAG TPA: hypothetical protein ACQGQI_06460 [Xylella sp.]
MFAESWFVVPFSVIECGYVLVSGSALYALMGICDVGAIVDGACDAVCLDVLQNVASEFECWSECH